MSSPYRLHNPRYPEGNPFLVMTSKKFHFTLSFVFYSKSILRINPFLGYFQGCSHAHANPANMAGPTCRDATLGGRERGGRLGLHSATRGGFAAFAWLHGCPTGHTLATHAHSVDAAPHASTTADSLTPLHLMYYFMQNYLSFQNISHFDESRLRLINDLSSPRSNSTIVLITLSSTLTKHIGLYCLILLTSLIFGTKVITP
jgi:hypothetical protein